MFLIEEEERKNKKNASLNVESKDVENKLKNENVNSKKEYSLKDCVLSQSTMVMWGYPTPPPSTTSFSTSNTTSSTSSNSTPLPLLSTSYPTLPISISSSSLSTSFTTVSLNSESFPKETSLLSLPRSSSSSSKNVPNSVEKRIREEDSSVSYDDVVKKKMRKECTVGTLQEGSQGNFLGGNNEDEKEIIEAHQKLGTIGEELSKTANKDNNNKSEESGGEETGNEVRENEDAGVAIVQRNNKEEETIVDHNTVQQNTVDQNTAGGKTVTVSDTGAEDKEKEEENINNSNDQSSSDVNDYPAIGSRVGSVPTEKEAREIFSKKRIVSEHMYKTDKNENEVNYDDGNNNNNDHNGNDSVKQRDGDAVTPSMLVFPAYTVSMQLTRGGPNTGPGFSAFHSTVSKISRDFSCLWTPSSSSDCTATART